MPAQPSIRPWKTSQPQPGYPDWWPRWRSPDIFVDNDGDLLESSDGLFKYYQNVDEAGEPIKGGERPNYLNAVIRNLGTSTAYNVNVRFSYAPYGVVDGALYRHEHFKEIGVAQVELAPVNQPNSEKRIEIEWDLNDLTENNLGLWPAPIAFFNHFCVRVEIAYPGELVPGSVNTQHNFTNVSVSSSPAPIYLMVTNADNKEKNIKFSARATHRGSALRLRGLDKIQLPFSIPMWRPKEIINEIAAQKSLPELGAKKLVSLGSLSLRPRESKLVTLAIANLELKEKQFIEVSFKGDGDEMGGVSISAQKGRPAIRRLPSRRAACIQRNITLPSIPKKSIKLIKEGGS